MKAVVTGSEGYIGSHLVYHLEQGGVEVTKIDAELVGTHLLYDWEHVKPMIEEADVIFHLAAKTPKGKVSGSYWDNNVGATYRIMEVLQPHQRLIAVSSCCVYRGLWDHDYRRSKVVMEKIIHHIGSRNPSKHVVRFGNVWGRKGNGVIDTWIQKAMIDRPIVLHESQRRDFVHVLEVVNVLMYIDAMIRSDAKVPPVLDIASGTNINIREVLEDILRYTNSRSFVSKEDKEVSWGISSPAWLLSQGWKPQYPLETTLKKECQWYENQSKR